MAYMFADTSNKVGFRPYHQTDPFGAAHLSVSGDTSDAGLGDYHFNRPFDPWELYPDVGPGLHGLGDLGQNHPFKPEAWQLHGWGASDTEQAADELLSAGHLTQEQHDAIINGSLSFHSALGFDPTEQSSWFDFTDILRGWNHDLQSLEAEVMHDPALAKAIGAQLIQKRNEYQGIASEFIRYYTLIAGSAPSGLAGLGIGPVVWFVAGSAAFLVLAYLAHEAFQTWRAGIDVNQIKAHTEQQAAGTDQQLAEQLARAQAAGDTASANAIIALMRERAAGGGGVGHSDFAAWFEKNIKWIGLGFVGIVLLPNLTSGLGNVFSPGKRQVTKVTRETS